ncbi:MAG: tetratricopeptide repeat protein [Magnetococcus sp. MYC-9]
MNTHRMSEESRCRLAVGDLQGCIDSVACSEEGGEVPAPQLLTRAVAYMQLCQYQEALADCEKAMHKDPDNKHLHFISGSVLRRMNRLEDAITHLNWAIDIHPEYGIAYLERAFCHTMAGRYTEAAQDFRMAVQCTETSLQGFCDATGIVRMHRDAVETLLLDYPRLDSMKRHHGVGRRPPIGPHGMPAPPPEGGMGDARGAGT